MVVATTVTKNVYSGDGSNKSFPFTFRVGAASDIVLFSTVVATGVTTTISASDYSLVVNGNLVGGTVTYPLGPAAAVASTIKITVARARPYVQPVQVENQTRFFPSVLAEGLDNLAMQVQQVNEEVARAVKNNISETTELTFGDITSQRAAAEAAAIAAAADAVQVALDLLATEADTVATAADRVQTGLDRAATADYVAGAGVLQGVNNLSDLVDAAVALTNLGLTATAVELNILDGMTLTTAQINSTAQLAGRNLIINGSGRINQRGYVSGTPTVGGNRFTLDRWFVNFSGQNLTFTGNDAGRTMTAPAGGVLQVIEGANIVGGTYVISWTGTATCAVNGIGRANGATFTLTANTNVTVRFGSGTYTDVQIELGTVATAFERVNIGLELAQCQRYFNIMPDVEYLTYQAGGAGFRTHVSYKVVMRAAPTVTLSNITFVNASAAGVVGVNSHGCSFGALSSGIGPTGVEADLTLNAELTA